MNARLPHLALMNAAIEIGDGAIQVDASIVGEELGLEPQEVLSLIRANAITSVCEHGIDDDAGRYRLTFFHKSRRLRLIVDDCGRVVRRSTIDFGDRPLRARMHPIGE
jgi:hypothetical protein